MITRLVKMEFKQDLVIEFLSIFEKTKDKIRATEGCQDLVLLRETQNGNIFFTISKWESEEDLQSYRQSVLFKETWSATKKLFKNSAEAWSTEEWM